VYLRNICAHHSRLWNKEMRIQPRIPLKPKREFLSKEALNKISNNRLFYSLSMIIFLVKAIDQKSTLVDSIKDLFSKYPDSDPEATGFPDNWEQEKLWSN
jgi:abortive infection bacteriophage resistance protein